MKTCLNCFYINRNWLEIPCRTCMENDNHDNWTGVDEEESEEYKEESLKGGEQWEK